MKTLAFCLLAAALATLLPAAPFAARHEPPPPAERPSAGRIEGIVTMLDPATRTIGVDDATYALGRGVNIGRIRLGDRVRAELRLGRRGALVVHTLEVLGPPAPQGPPG